MSNDAPAAMEAPKQRWVGVLLSVLVPGFGLVRAGRIARGVAWFLALQVLGVVVTLSAIWRSVPFWGVLAGLVVALACQLAMLVDSFRPGKLSARLWAIFVIALLAIIFVPSAPHLFARAFKIPTGGMEPTLRGRSQGAADQIIVDRLSYLFSPPARGDLVVFRTIGIAGMPTDMPADTFFFQRLVGLPGEKIEIREGRVFADARPLTERDGIPGITYTIPPARSSTTQAGVYEVPPDAYFTLGDNSPHSFDSRYWGGVPKANIYGRVSRIYYPFSRASVPR
jgi:signal peptidase I